MCKSPSRTALSPRRLPCPCRPSLRSPDPPSCPRAGLCRRRDSLRNVLRAWRQPWGYLLRVSFHEAFARRCLPGPSPRGPAFSPRPPLGRPSAGGGRSARWRPCLGAFPTCSGRTLCQQLGFGAALVETAACVSQWTRQVGEAALCGARLHPVEMKGAPRGTLPERGRGSSSYPWFDGACNHPPQQGWPGSEGLEPVRWEYGGQKVEEMYLNAT